MSTLPSLFSISTTKTFINIPSTGATPKPLHAIRSERQCALVHCNQLNPHNSHNKLGRQKSIPITISCFPRDSSLRLSRHPSSKMERKSITNYSSITGILSSITVCVPSPHTTHAGTQSTSRPKPLLEPLSLPSFPAARHAHGAQIQSVTGRRRSPIQGEGDARWTGSVTSGRVCVPGQRAVRPTAIYAHKADAR